MKNPSKVEYAFPEAEIKEKAEAFLFEKIGEHVELEIRIDQDYDDLFDIYPDEERNDEETLELLSANGFPWNNRDDFKSALFDALIKVPYGAFLEMQNERRAAGKNRFAPFFVVQFKKYHKEGRWP